MRRRRQTLPDLQRKLAANLKRLRLASRMSQEELASAAGLVSRHVQKIESAQVNVTLRTLAALATALDAEASDLLLGKPNGHIATR
jgi:transcriptional regulator with XRE-family HTH domain